MTKYFEFEQHSTIVCLDTIAAVTVMQPTKDARTQETSKHRIEIHCKGTQKVMILPYNKMDDLIVDYTRLKEILLCQ